MKARSILVSLTAAVLVAGGGAAADSTPRAAPPPAFAEWAAAVDAPQVGALVTLPGALAIGRARITPQPGCTTRVLTAGGERCGLLLSGPAELVYRVEDRFSAPVARRNLHRASSLELTERDGSQVVQETLEGAVVWGWDLPGTVQDTADTAAPGDLPGWVGELLDHPFFAHPSHDLAVARHFAGAPAGTAYALLKGKHGFYLLEVDPVVRRSEAFERLDKSTSSNPVYKGRYGPENLVTQPIGRQWWDRFPAPLVAEHEAFTVDNDHDEHAVITTRSTLRTTRAGVGLWRASLWQSVVDDATELPVTVRSVKVNGKSAPFVHQDSELLVLLDPPPALGATTEVEVVHEGELAQHPGGDSYFSLPPGAWYPQPPLNGELATMELTVKAPEPFIPFASGVTTSRTTENGVTTVVTKVEHPMQFPAVAAGKYHVLSDTQEGHSCNVAAYVFGKESASKKLLNNFFAATKFYQMLFDTPYPFSDEDIIEVNTWGFGQAPPGIIFITKEAFDPIGETMSQIFSQGVNERVVHEIAHAWWGHVLKMDSLEEQWLTESFAEYSAALCLEAMRGGGKRGEREFKKILNGWKGGESMVGDGGSIYLANYLAMHDSRDYMDRTRLLYHKGPLVLHALRQELARRLGSKEKGDRYFFALLRSFLKNFTYKWGGTRHLVGILNQITKDDWQPWFERYVYGCEMPEVKD